MVSVEQLRVPLRIIERLKKAGIVEIEQLMGIDEFTLAKLIDVGVDRAKQIIKEAWFAYNPQVLGAEELFKKELEEDKIPTPFKSLNNWFGGGYPVGTLTEFYGIFGTGKTTMLMTSAVAAIKNGFSVLWIDTEKTFSTRRFLQIANAWGVSEEEIKKHFKYILATSASELIMLFNVNFPLILKDYKEKGDEIKLIAIDSLTAPFRSDYAGISELQERQQQLNKVLRTLLRLGEIFKFATLYSNQVVAIPDRFDNYAPVGGHVVSHITNHIFKLRKSGKKRFLVAQDVPFMPQIEIEFKITEKGVEEVVKE